MLSGYEFKKILLGEAKSESEIRMQGGKLYLGNISHSVTPDELTELFSTYGEVRHVRLIMVEGRGFGFVEMANQLEAATAKESLNNSEFRGRPLKFIEAYLPRRG